MAANKERKLFSEFPPVSTAQWEEVIDADLKGADYAKKLIWRTREGFDVRPYYRAEDLVPLKHLGAGPGEFPYVRGTEKCNRWLIFQTITVDDPARANAEALKAIAAGAEAIGYRVKLREFAMSDMETLMRGIDTEKIEVTFSGRNINDIAGFAVGYADSNRLDPERTRINVVYDPICSRLTLRGAFRCGTRDGGECFGAIAKMAAAAAKYKNMRLVTVCGHNFGDSGASITQELAFTLAAGHEYVVRLMEAGMDADSAARTLRFSMGVSTNYFMEIAKLRAARMLWATIMRRYGVGACAEKICIHAVSSRWSMTVYDPYVNMLRGTTEAMSAAIGGVHSMEVLPFDAAYECPTEFSSRIARNVQLLLKHESHFDNVADPSGGSYYIETLTDNIARRAWELFLEVEEAGGYIEAFQAGFIQRVVGESAAKKNLDVSTRKIVLLGTNQYPNTNEVADEAVTADTVTRGVCVCGCGECAGTEDSECECGECNAGCGCPDMAERLRLVRGSQPFEEMRLRVDRSGRAPRVFMLTCGTLGMARARAQFSGNFFGCAGFRIIDNTFFKSVREGVDAAIAAKAEIVVICAADADYETLAPEAFELLGGKAVFVVAGAPECQPRLEEQGITNFISVKSNVLVTLMKYVKDLGI